MLTKNKDYPSDHTLQLMHALLKRFNFPFEEFFRSYPAWGLALGALVSTFFHPLYMLPFCLVKKIRIYALLIFICSSMAHDGAKELSEGQCEYQGVFTPIKETSKASFFSQNLYVKGVLKTKNGSFYMTFIKGPSCEFLTHVCSLDVQVAWKENLPKLTIQNHKILKPSPWLFVFRSKLGHQLKLLTEHPVFIEEGQLLYALFTGQIDNKLLKLQFQDHGLSHILALSGFHLNLILAFASFILAHILRLKYAHELGLILLTCYLLFTGIQSSIIRAYTMSICGYLHHKRSLKTNALHLFSLSLLMTSYLCKDMTSSPGFILSFTATLCLIIFPNVWEKIFSRLGEAEGTWEKLIYTWLKLIALQSFVFIITAPIILYFFASLHFKSVFFNLIYPLFLSFFMMIGGALCLLKALSFPLADELLHFVYYVGHLLLEGIKKPLSSSGGQIQLPPSFLMMIGALCLLLALVFWSSKKKQSR